MTTRRLHPIAVRALRGCSGRVPPALLRSAARAVMAAEGVALDVGVEVVLADAATVRGLNRLYRGQDEPTDVLSFAASEAGTAFVEAPGAEASLGEVIVCLPIAEAQAREAGHAIEGEIAHLVVHGLLHILGYDHAEPYEGARMKSREDELLSALGYQGQYAHGH